MKRRGPKPLLVDQFNRPFASWNFYEGADRAPDGDFLGHLMRPSRDTDSDLPVIDFETLRQSARKQFANEPILKGVMLEQANYSFPISIHYTGADADAGVIMKEYLHHWDAVCDVRGEPYDCATGSRLRLIGRKIDGDIALVCVVENNEPRLQMIRGHRLGNGAQKIKNGVLEEGAWRGWRIRNGVVSNSYGRMAAICVVGEKPDGDQFIPESPRQLADYGGLSPVRLLYDPLASDQSRGITALEASLKSFRSHKQWHEAEMRAQVLQANETFLEWNDAGEGMPGPGDSDAEGVVITDSAGLPALRTQKGQSRYYRSSSGGKLELVSPERPGEGVMRFDDKTITQAIFGLGWDANFALLLKDPSGTNARVMLDKIKRTIRQNQSIEARTLLWCKTWALAHAIERKEIPRPKDGDITSWDFTGPPLPSADNGNDSQARLDQYRLGLLTAQRFFAEQDLWWEEQFSQRKIEISVRITQAKELHAEHPEFSEAECYALLEQRYPNAPNTTAPAKPGAVEDPDSPPPATT